MGLNTFKPYFHGKTRPYSAPFLIKASNAFHTFQQPSIANGFIAFINTQPSTIRRKSETINRRWDRAFGLGHNKVSK